MRKAGYKMILVVIGILTTTFTACNGKAKEGKVQDGTVYEIEKEHLPIADPYILCYNNKYYAYGTHTDGFGVFISEDLKHWKRGPMVLSPENSWGTRYYWAPEVYYVPSKNKFFMFYSVDEHINVATADSPEGPFVQDPKQPIVEEKGIDTSLFIDTDGKAYLYYVRFTDGNVIWVAEMEEDLKHIKTETLTQCVSAVEPWETMMGKVTEGPSVVKEGDTYYLLYSANDYRSQDYGVGCATAKSPLGPWTKQESNPVFKRGMKNTKDWVGIGHGAPFKDLDGKYMYVFHVHQNDTTIHPRHALINTDLRFSDGKAVIDGEVIEPCLVK